MNDAPAKAGAHQMRGWKAWADHPFFVLRAGFSPKAGPSMSAFGHPAIAANHLIAAFVSNDWWLRSKANIAV